ncbi:hypothetical protein LTR36_010242 [Oleoguttula mirabilis]|uniref:Uncharacterized protein n=1 Tax=Oleoguttula mirabilis TaxID=1507867 RepID=A0AAV9JRV2_9PEZI|nr:hypothetical protein LTR36_010242 [Oleoguttula mirabilis]
MPKGDALKLPKHQPPSPTPLSRPRPALSRANEGRKVSAGTLGRWRADAKGWVSKTAFAAASPRETATTIGAGLSTSRSQPFLSDDQFVVHMPSAREPQPYFYPGRTPDEIEAFEHYKREARPLSGDGKASGGVRKVSAGNAHRCDRAAQANMNERSNIDDGVNTRLPTVIMPNQPGGSHGISQDTPSVGGAELSAATFAPFRSPRTPASKPAAEDTVLNTIRLPGTFRDLPPEHLSQVSPIPRKPVRTPPNDELCVYKGADSPEVGHATRLTDLSQLPRIRLIHPNVAGLPQSHALRHPRDGIRLCSLGCRRELDTGQCSDSRHAFNNNGAADTHLSLFDGDIQRDLAGTASASKADEVVELFFSLAASALDVGRHVHLPNFGILEALRAPDATPQQKVDALKALLTLTVQGLALLMVITMLWRLGAAVMHVFEVLLWPLAAPFKILRWLVGYA